MERPVRAKKPQLFQREQSILSEAKGALAGSTDVKEQMTELIGHYEDLLDQSKLITKVSDRLQKKILRATTAVEEKNAELQHTLDSLTKAKAGRKATTITMFIAIGMFLFAEGILEPQIDKWVATTELSTWLLGDVNFVGLGLKGTLMLLIRPIEKIVEKRMLAKAVKEEEEKANLAKKK